MVMLVSIVMGGAVGFGMSYLMFNTKIASMEIDLLVLLVIFSGKVFHVERHSKIPRIIHAETLSDLRGSEVSLSSKLSFLKRYGIKHSLKMIDRKLRNNIAHLNFDITKEGVVHAPHDSKKQIDIFKKINESIRFYMIVFTVLTLGKLGRILERKVSE